MPNPLIKTLAKKAGVKKAKVEKTWRELKKEYGSNYKAIVGTLEKIYGQDSNRSMTEFGHLKVEECVLTAESVDAYLGSELPGGPEIQPDKIYQVYRPGSEIKKALQSYNEVPLVNEHYFVDSNKDNRDKWLGTTGSDSYFKDGKLYNTVAIWNKEGTDLVERVKQGLSCGYKFNLVPEHGVWNGKAYDFRMSDIVCNHVALVGSPRVKVAKLADSLKNVLIEGNDMNAAGILKVLMRKNPQLVTDASEEYEKEEKEMKDKKKGRDNESHREKTGGNESTDAEHEEMEKEEKEMKDKKKGRDNLYKDKKGKDKKAKDKKGKDAEKCEDMTAPMTGDDISKIVQAQLKAYNNANRLCEKVLGKTAFASDALPEQMFEQTLRAKGIKCDGYSLDTKEALVKYIGDNKTAQRQFKPVAMDSNADDGYKSSFGGEK